MDSVTQNQHNSTIKAYSFCDGDADGPRGGRVAAGDVAYLTRTNNSHSALYKVRNSWSERTDLDRENIREKSVQLHCDFEKLKPVVFDALIKRGFYRIKKVNDSEFEVYSVPNRTGNNSSAFSNKNLSNSTNARFSSRNRLIEIIKANTDFCYFFTGTFDPRKHDRTNFSKLQRSLTLWLRRRGIKYILIPEPHKDGSIHFHGFFNETVEPFLADFDLSKKLPLKITQGIKEGREIKNFPEYAAMFGWVSIERVRSLEACAVYVSKYVTKSFDSVRFSTRRYFCSTNLKKPVFVMRPQARVDGLMATYSDFIPKVTFRRPVPSRAVSQRSSLGSEALLFRRCSPHPALPHRLACRGTGRDDSLVGPPIGEPVFG